MTDSRWIYLSDLAPRAVIRNLTTGEMRSIMSSAVKDRAPTGLRRYVLEELSGGMYQETGECLALTPALTDDLIEFHNFPNNWNYDWVHPTTEFPGDDPAAHERIAHLLSAQMAAQPYDFQIVGLQRRLLWYYSDGSLESQKRFEAYLPHPDRYPYRQDGTFRHRYNWTYNSLMRDAEARVPKLGYEVGGCYPLLYRGPAWTVRFLLDGQDVLLDRCRVYVDDDAQFICSDWCQRHDYTSYGNGINLQVKAYSFEGWVTGPCIIKNIESGKFTPRQVTVKREAVRELMRRTPKTVAIPDFTEEYTKVKALVDKLQPTTPTPVAEITAEVMAEAFALSGGVMSPAAVSDLAPAAETLTLPAEESATATDENLALTA